MARIAKPTAIQRQSGAFEHDPARGRARNDEPIPAKPLGEPPKHLTPPEQDIWCELAEALPEGVLTIADRMALELLCRKMASFRAGCDLKAADMNAMISLFARLGMTPADRARLKAPQPKKNKFAAFNVQ